MADEKDLIQGAHAGTIKELYSVFCRACIEAKTDADRQAAEIRFRDGILAARGIRDRAIKVVQAI